MVTLALAQNLPLALVALPPPPLAVVVVGGVLVVRQSMPKPSTPSCCGSRPERSPLHRPCRISSRCAHVRALPVRTHVLCIVPAVHH